LLRIPFSFNQLNIFHADIPRVFDNDGGEAARSAQPYKPVNITPPKYNSPPSIPTEYDDPPTKPERIQFPVPKRLLPLLHRQPVETGNTMPQSRKKLSPTSTKNPRFAPYQAEKAMKRIVPIDQSNTWEKAVGRIKWVMDTLNPTAEVRVMPFDVLG